MNTNQLATLVKYVEKNDWHNLCQYYSAEFNHLDFEKKIKNISDIQKKITTVFHNINQRNNTLKWLINELSSSWIISEKKLNYAKVLNTEWLEFLNSEQLLTIIKLFWQEGEIDFAEKMIAKYWSMSPCLAEKGKEKKIEEIIIHSKDPMLCYMALSYCIDIGDQENTKKYYQSFYKFYFEKFNLEDEKNILWDLLWNKVSTINENWAIWEMLKLDVGLITDIIVKNKTKLKIPYFRKKRDLSSAIILRDKWETFNTTLLKYFECIENSNLIYQWMEIIQNSKSKIDLDSEQICLKLKLSKPKAIPQGRESISDDTINSTQILSQESQVNYNLDIREINKKIEKFDDANKKTFDVNMQNVLKENNKVHWQEKVNILMLHEDFESVLEIIEKNIGSLPPEDKIDFEIFRLEILLKVGEFQEVLNKVESLWKGVQELEVFKIYKYLEGEALWMLNRKKEAIDCYRKVVDIDPGYKLAKWRLIEYNI